MADQLDGRSVYLTGGTGFLGSHLRERLAATDCTVTLLVQPGASVETGPDETVVRGSVTDPETVEIDHDVVIHLAGLTSVDGALADPTTTWQVNADGTQTVLEAARRGDPERVLYASTASVYGRPAYLPIDESHPLEPVEPYGASKLAGDRLAATYAHAYDLPVVLPRLFNTFGPRGPRHNVVGWIVTQALAGDVIELRTRTPERDFTYVDDTVDALLTVLFEGEGGEAYNVGRGEAISVGALAERVAGLFDREIEIRTAEGRKRLADVDRHVADASKLRALGWEPETDLETGLEATVEWFARERA